MTGASVIVVGGGILGATTFYELASAGVDVLLLDAKRFGGQSTAKSGAIVRCHYSNPEVVRMAVRSRETLRRLPLILDCDRVYEQTGWLFLVDEAHAEAAVANAEMQDAEGLDTVDVEDLQELLPGVEEDGIAYALYEPESGFADPVATTRAYVQAGLRAGGRAEENAPVESLEFGKATGVRVRGELLECDAIVLAAGAWSKPLAAGVGLELPLEITREQYVFFSTDPATTTPCAVSSQIDSFYMRPAPEQGDTHVLAGRGFPKEYERADPDSYDERFDAAFEEDVRGRVVTRLPLLENMQTAGGRVGLYEVTPDWHPLLGPVDGFEGLHLATGGSGHCFKLGPAIGQMVAGGVLGLETRYANLDRFSVGRFAAGHELQSTYGGNRA